MEFPDFLHRGSMSLLLNIVQGLCSTSVKDCPVLTVTWTTLFSIHSLTLVGNLGFSILHKVTYASFKCARSPL